ncbi:UPF0301 protein [Desulfuromonas versatilis]|uniref:UPF0301 protein n=1 Tax=Desulfuromonas versatilis TaxID=2802975 RepID=A0ABN6E1T7_9BACT|nr:YqgE/AlgH family protein [Desulfuromonas versatilis]BCR06268.1 UPF0301 protein [Desulfuromonas versatilis]
MKRTRLARAWKFLLCLMLTLTAAGGTAQVFGQTGMAPRVGTFLVAAEAIKDPRFQQTVILLVRHDLGGTVGLVVNRPAVVAPQKVLPELPEQFAGLFFGGPVSPLRPMVLLRSSNPPADSLAVLERTHVVGLDEVLRHLTGGGRPGELFRIYLGYAGWSAGQLAREISRGDWQVVAGEEKAIFEEDPAGLWERLHQAGTIITI